MTCTRCRAEMTAVEFVDPGATCLMWMMGWRCDGYGHDNNAVHRHKCLLRQGLSQVVSMIDEDQDVVPLGWEAYTGQSV